MKLVFKGATEYAVLELDRETKILYVTSTKTNNVKTLADWKMLFDKGKEAKQEKLTDSLSDPLFMKVIAKAMGQNGYKLTYSKC